MNLTNYLFVRNILLFIELLSWEFIFLCRQKRRKLFVLRLFLIPAVAALIYGISRAQVSFIFRDYDSVLLNGIGGFISYLLVFFSSVFVSGFLFRSNIYSLTFSCSMGYCVQQFIYNGYLLLLNLIYPDAIFFKYNQMTLVNFLWFLVYYLITYLLLLLLAFKTHIVKKNMTASKSVFVLLSLVLLINVIIGTISEIYSSSNRPLRILCIAEAMISLGLVLVLQLYILTHVYDQNELKIEKNIVSTQESQYRFSKATLEMMNLKTHDLKHQVAILRKGGEEADKLLNDLEELTKRNEVIVKEDNDTVSVALFEKWMYCDKNGISLKQTVTPHALHFMNESEVYSLIGNILDNAINAVQNCSEEKRIIHFSISCIHGVSLIICDNYYEGELKMEDGLPKTSNKDKSTHGYGLRSIRFICDKYDGNLSVSAENGIFTLQISIPEPVDFSTESGR